MPAAVQSVGVLQPFERGVLHGLSTSKRFPSCSRPKTAATVYLGRRMWVRLHRYQCMSFYLETSRNYIYTHGDVRKTRPARRTIWKGQPMLTFSKESYSTDLHHDAPQNHGPTRSFDSEVCPPSCRSIPDCQGRKSPTKSEQKMVKELPCCWTDCTHKHHCPLPVSIPCRTASSKLQQEPKNSAGGTGSRKTRSA